MQNESQMYCSDCFFFRNDGICKNPKTPRRDVGYFQKAGSCFTDPKEQNEAELEQPAAGIAQESPKIEQKPMEKEQNTRPATNTKVCADCGRELPIESFQKNVKGERISVCKECMSKRRKAGKTKLPKGTPEQHLLDAVAVRMEKTAELCKCLTDADLAGELRRRGYSGKLTRNQELNV